MSDPHANVTLQDRVKAWTVVALICLAVFAYGAILIFTVGDKGQPAWDYGGVEFVPGGSPYSTDTQDRKMWKP